VKALRPKAELCSAERCLSRSVSRRRAPSIDDREAAGDGSSPPGLLLLLLRAAPGLLALNAMPAALRA
jgi:hypothetical protein